MSRFSGFLKIFTVLFAVLAVGAVGAMGLFATQQVTFGEPDVVEQVMPVGEKPGDLLQTLKYNPDQNITPTKVLHSCGAYSCGRAYFGFRRCCRTCKQWLPSWFPTPPAPLDGPRKEIDITICRIFYTR